MLGGIQQNAGIRIPISVCSAMMALVEPLSGFIYLHNPYLSFYKHQVSL